MHIVDTLMIHRILLFKIVVFNLDDLLSIFAGPIKFHQSIILCRQNF